MQAEPGQPWFTSAVERLDPRRRDRLLAVDCTMREAASLCQLVGSDGEVTFVLRDQATAEQIAERDWPRARVLAHRVDGAEKFGTFDALLIAPRVGPLLDVDAYAALVGHNLRPGGRFVIDVPAQDMVPDLRAAWLDLGWDEERLQPLIGPSDLQLADALHRAHLRNVHAALGSHLLHLTAPADLVAAFADALALDEHGRTELAHAVVRRRQDAGPLDALVHRTQVSGQR